MGNTFNIAETLLADEKGFYILSSLWEMLSSKNIGQTVFLNFDAVNLIDANLSAAIGAILDESSKRDISIFLTMPKVKSVRRSLSRIGFLGAFSVDTKIEDRENYIKYKRFSAKETVEFKEHIHSDLIQKKRFPQCTKKAEDKIIESIYEVFANAVSHTGCEYVYSCGECHEHEQIPMLDMTITNLGKTIPQNVNEYFAKKGKEKLSSKDTLLWAFEEGNTTKSVPGGLGLAILREFIDLNEGEIQMVSGDAMLEYKNKTFSAKSLEKQFPGTIVNLKINCADNKTYSLKNEFENPQDLL